MDRIVSNEELEFEGEVQKNLRPKRLAEYIGQESLKEKEVEASVGGGAVVVKANGQKDIVSIKISEETIKDAVEDKEMLEDLVLSAVTEAMRQADELAEKEMSAVTGGINIPGLF